MWQMFKLKRMLTAGPAQLGSVGSYEEVCRVVDDFWPIG